MDESVEIAELMGRVRGGEMRALARAVSLVEDGGAAAGGILAACAGTAGRALRVGVTGSPGAGKSTLVDQMAKALRRQGKTVGIVAVDPSSPYTGGALLGDRIRMQGFVADAGVYIRSMASRGAVGGVARTAAGVCSVMEAAGREVLLIETVGVGQDEVEIVGLADVVVVVVVPGMGDDVQSLKAGLMETADVFVVNKADREGADRVEAELRAMQSLGQAEGAWVPRILKTVATSGEGVEGLLEAVRGCVEGRGKRRAMASFGSGFGWGSGSGSGSGSSSLLGAVRAGGQEAARAAMVVDHLGIAVRSIAAARGFYESLGMRVTHEETVQHEQVKTAMLPVGETRFELLEATVEDSTIGRFVAKRGEGLHHVALRVPDVDALFVRLQEQGVRLASQEVKVGAGGHRYFFVHPASTGGVLMELVGE